MTFYTTIIWMFYVSRTYFKHFKKNVFLFKRISPILTPYYKFNLIKSDPNDNKFLNYAVIANAKFIMTEDRHFVADTVWKNEQSQLKAINTILSL